MLTLSTDNKASMTAMLRIHVYPLVQQGIWFFRYN